MRSIINSTDDIRKLRQVSHQITMAFWRLAQASDILVQILNSSVHSNVNRSLVPKPVIRILCALLVYKKRVTLIHSLNIEKVLCLRYQEVRCGMELEKEKRRRGNCVEFLLAIFMEVHADEFGSSFHLK